MREYQIKFQGGEEVNNPITYNKLFDEKDIIVVEGDFKKNAEITLGNISEVYKLLRNEIAIKSPRSFEEYTICIEQAIIKYFGFYCDIDKCLSFYLNKKNEKTIAALAKKNIATSIERAIIAQNLLIECCIDTIFKMNEVLIDDEKILHAYNLVTNDNKYYIFDATIPTIKNSSYSPIICEISEDRYNALINDQESIMVTHLNPLQNKEYRVTYGNIIKEKDKSLTKNR